MSGIVKGVVRPRQKKCKRVVRQPWNLSEGTRLGGARLSQPQRRDENTGSGRFGNPSSIGLLRLRQPRSAEGHRPVTLEDAFRELSAHQMFEDHLIERGVIALRY